MNDFLLNPETGDLLIKDGDLVVGESDDQNKRLLLVCEKGSFKEFPATCVGASTFLESEDPAAFLREVRNQFQADGMTVNRVAFGDDGHLKVDASY